MNIFNCFQKSAERLKSKLIESFRKEDSHLNINFTFSLHVFSEFVLVLSIIIALFATILPGSSNVIIKLYGMIPAVSIFISGCTVLAACICMLMLHKLYYPRVREDIAENPEMRKEYVLDITYFDAMHFFRIVLLLYTLGVLFGISAPSDELGVKMLELSFLSAILPFGAAWLSGYMLKTQHRKHVEV